MSSPNIALSEESVKLIKSRLHLLSRDAKQILYNIINEKKSVIVEMNQDIDYIIFKYRVCLVNPALQEIFYFFKFFPDLGFVPVVGVNPGSRYFIYLTAVKRSNSGALASFANEENK